MAILPQKVGDPSLGWGSLRGSGIPPPTASGSPRRVVIPSLAQDPLLFSVILAAIPRGLRPLGIAAIISLGFKNNIPYLSAKSA